MRLVLVLISGAILVGALCGGCAAQQTATAPVTDTLIVRTWEEDMPADLFVDFTQQTGIQIQMQPYESQEDAVADLKTGSPADVIVMDSRFIPGLVARDELRQIDRSNVPNFRYISAAFRGLSFDPNNQYSVPYQWGTTGIVYRRDLTGREITRWRDLWDVDYQGKIGLWRSQPRETIGLTLKMLGFSANSESPEELAAAMRKLEELRPHIIWLEDIDPYTSAPALIDNQVYIALGYVFDEIEGQKHNPNIHFVLPAEGAVLWGEHFVMPSASQHPGEAEQLLNYLLNANVMAEVGNYNCYAVAHDGALQFIGEAFRHNPHIYPTNDLLANAEIVVAISDQAEQRYMAAWAEFTGTAQEGE